MSSLSTCSKSLRETNGLLFKFLWDGKGDKIKQTEMIADYCNGGQKMLDIMELKKSLKIAWKLKYISDECKSNGKCFFYFHLSKMGGKLVFLGNLSKKGGTKLNVKNNFLQKLLEIWADSNYRDSFVSQRDLSGNLIWNNSLVRIAGKTVFYKH